MRLKPLLKMVADWAAKLQFHCETFWEHLNDVKDDTTPPQEALEVLINPHFKDFSSPLASSTISSVISAKEDLIYSSWLASKTSRICAFLIQIKNVASTENGEMEVEWGISFSCNRVYNTNKPVQCSFL